MPVKAYVGMPRAGKSYEVVTKVILSSLRQGRRVISNIAGLNYDAMCQVLYAEGLPQESIGSLVCVTHAEVEKPNFWRTDTDSDNGFETFIQPGDLVALDEIWRFWKKRGDIHPRAMNFMRMHGHFTHPVTGLTCEVALITQSIKDINENIREVVAETFQMVKNTKIGSDKSYIVHVFSRGSTNKSDFIRTLAPRFYNPEYFSMYKSHSQHKDGDALAVESNPDDRGNILKGALFKIGIPLAFLLMLPAVFFVWKYFHPTAPVSVSTAPQPTFTLPASSVVAVPASVAPSPSDSWRVSGYYISGESVSVALQNSSGALRFLQNPPSFKITPLSFEVELPEGGFASSWATIATITDGALNP